MIRLYRFPAFVIAALFLGATMPERVGAETSVYEGAPVDVVPAGNGALINADLARHPFMKNDPRIVKVRERVWSVTGYSLANCSFVETDGGIVVFDTGNNVGQGTYFREAIRSVTDKPVIAIIYSHSHYVGGAAALAGDGQEPPLIIGHPSLSRATPGDVALGAARLRRANLQFGAYLPLEGPDARATTPEPEFDDPEMQRTGFMPVTRPVQDGETIELGGTAFTFMWTVADTKDSLSVWIPELDTVLTNTVAIMFYPLYTLRGEVYREPEEIIESYDRLRALSPEHYVPVHGSPVSGASEVEKRLTLHRDAYAFTYNQALRAINLGWTPDQMVERIHLPERFRQEPTLYEVYSEFPYALRGIYRGLVGWFDEDTAELNPPAPQTLGAAIADGFGGMDALVDASKEALARKEYNLAASLAGFAVDAAPENTDARQAKADALRMLARVSKGMQSHNFYLTEALALEGKIDRFAPPATPVFAAGSPRQMARLPARQLARLLESRVNPQRTAGLDASYTIEFTDVDEAYRVDVRDGVAEVKADTTGHPAAFRLTRLEWVGLLFQSAPACEADSRLCEFASYFRS